jgi:hypothetical protein
MKRLTLLLALVTSAVALRAAPALPVSASNSALRLTVTAVTASTSYGGTTASSGHQFVALTTTWENRIDPKLAASRGLATNYLIEDLAKHLFLVMDGQYLGELRGKMSNHGKTSLGGLSLEKVGAKVNADVVYELPAGTPKSLDLRFYDDTTGYFQIALADPAPELKPLFPIQSDAVAEVGVYAVEDPAKGVTAPKGFRAVSVELRARSVWQIEGEAPGYDASQAPGTMIKHINLLDWTETRKYIHLLVDGVYAYPPEATSTVPDTARFIPEFMTGGKLVFFVPADAQNVELFCELPHASAPGSPTLDLPPMRFPLKGTAPAPSTAKPALAIQDEMFAINVEHAKRVPTFAGTKPDEGKQLLILSLSVTNQGTTGEFFQPHDQLLLLAADGSEVPLDDLTAKGPHRPEDLVHLPAGSRRQFDVVFQLDAAVKAPQLSFHGGSFMKAYDLPLEK